MSIPAMEQSVVVCPRNGRLLIAQFYISGGPRPTRQPQKCDRRQSVSSSTALVQPLLLQGTLYMFNMIHQSVHGGCHSINRPAVVLLISKHVPWERKHKGIALSISAPE